MRRIVTVSGRNSRYLYGSVICGLTLAVLNVAAAHFSAKMMDAMIDSDMSSFLHMAWITVALAAVRPVIIAAKRFASGTFGAQAAETLRESIAQRLPNSTAESSSSEHSGQILSKVSNDLQEVQSLVETRIPEILTVAVRAVLSLGYMLHTNWLLALIAVLGAPVIFGIVGRLNVPVMTVSKDVQKAIARANQVAAETLAGAETVRSFSLQERMSQVFKAHTDEWLRLSWKSGKLQSSVTAVGFGAFFTPFILVFGVGSFMILRGTLTAGAMMAFFELLDHTSQPLRTLPGELARMSSQAASAERVLDLIDSPVERSDGADLIPDPLAPVVEFKDVFFTYPGSLSPALSGLSFALNRGETVALAGGSGSGKTTVIRLVLGDYLADSGEIKVFGHPVSAWSLRALRQHFSHVEAMGGYTAAVAERGTNLSGGQMQRLAIARAILRDAPILLLDEATSSLDAESEGLVNEALDRLMEGRTTLVVAHRLSTVRAADEILCMAGGKILEHGTHDEFMNRPGLYRALVEEGLRPKGPENIGDGSSYSLSES